MPSNRHLFMLLVPISWALAIYTGLFFLELSFSKGGGVHDSYTFQQCGLVGYFTFPGIDTWEEATDGLLVSPHTEAKRFPQWDSNPTGTVRSPVQANSLTHSATAPPNIWK